ncbi:hypothetical protein ACFSKN_02085 [Mariniflexile gromovii]|uniref:Annexin n=1 Tax=Mariniflexile gromovii TaxID=362523 RepID=A0ABS4BP86_9FLAO|nr:hypothetical protein [Mariniflexile gromovii]MBP0902391.1 hypothetical protein [Mariniflexile gromovii]
MRNYKEYLPIAVVLAVVLYLVSKIGSALHGNEKSQVDLETKEKLGETKATLTKEKAKLIAENFYTALAGTSLGKDSKLLYAQFEKMKNQDDFNMVFNAFGKRQFSRFWDNVGDPWTSDLLDLLQILAVEISAVEQQFINNKYPHLTMF